MDKKQEKINNIIIILILVIIVALLGIILVSAFKGEKKSRNYENKTHKLVLLRGSGIYDYSKTKGVFDNYDDYLNLLETFDLYNYSNDYQDPFNMEDKFHSNKKYIYYGDIINPCQEEVEFKDYKLNNSTMTLNFKVNQKCGFCSSEYILFIIEIDKEIKVNKIEENFDYIKNKDCDYQTEDKPILYLYPTSKINVNVKLQKQNQILTSYPKYNNGWHVTAHPNGDLYDENNNYYYALYWDEINQNKVDFKEGFYVSRENSITFLEEKLEIIGLNKKEKNEFIMYWLPKLEKNEHNLIYFELTEEREANNKLIIEPKPDSLLRINMHIKNVDKKTNIKEQKLTTFNRTGFVAVEWGGTIYK